MNKEPISQLLGRLLMSYSGQEPERVRTAVAILAQDDPVKMEYYLNRAHQDYRDVLWWAEIQEEETKKKIALRGMTVNERLFELKLFLDWDTAVACSDRQRAVTILQKCDLADSDIAKIIAKHFK